MNRSRSLLFSAAISGAMLASFASAQVERPSLNNMWQVSAANGNFFQTTRFGSGDSVSGYTFVVANRDDGRLPVLTMVCDPLFAPNGQVRLLRRVGPDWIAYAHFRVPTTTPTNQPGPLLIPGTYLAVMGSDSQQPHINKQLMFVGVFLTTAQQIDHWQMAPGINKLVSIPFQASSFDVWRFSVQSRGDGAIPVVVMASNEVTNTISNTVMIFRRVSAGWVLHATWNPATSPPRPGIPLEPGEYGVAVATGVFGNINQYKNAVLLSGYWAAP